MSSLPQPRNLPNEQSSVFSILCRICYDGSSAEELITPCRCKGTVAYVHRSCLETWLAEANATNCELCHQVFHTERTPKYTTYQSLWRWFRYQPTANEVGRGIIGDLLACAAITPMAIIITYVCLFSSDYYHQKKFQSMAAAKWTSVSLLVMIGIMLVGYYMWVSSIIKLHMNVWYNWWQRECIVRYIPPPRLAEIREGITVHIEPSEESVASEFIEIERVESRRPPIRPHRVTPLAMKNLMLPTIEEVRSETIINVIQCTSQHFLKVDNNSTTVVEEIERSGTDEKDSPETSSTMSEHDEQDEELD